ncbi:MAG TPA: alpha/beta hydrolase [Mycobacteriales bacterium]|jgi:pimeloyl-ACP methyl ester carboxylesterase|nr:alpha/beta hydrolase [Mycobacteriales bacterium]
MADAQRDGVRLAYTEIPAEAGGENPRELVLLHGWGGHQGFMRRQQEFFVGRYRVVSVDLRGHGGSDESDTDYGMDRLAGDLLWLADRLELTNPVLVGHDLGAAVAVEAGRQAPARISAVVALDGPIAVSEESEYATLSISSGLQTPHYMEALHNIVERDMFLPTDDVEVRDWVFGEMQRVPQRVLVGTMVARHGWDSDAAIAECEVPTYYIASANTPADLRRLARTSPETSLGMTPEVGHFLQLLAPERVNRLIDTFLEGLYGLEGLHGTTSASSLANPALAPAAVDSTLGVPSATPIVPPTGMPSVPPPSTSPTAPSSLPPVI